ncbi:hypothetical protein PM082_007654 [Marasmius tenuissimus]|nr:hypothetical protein PM082_007654 [Marasmius tenuissimus]
MSSRPLLAGKRSKSRRHTLLPASRSISMGRAYELPTYSRIRWSFGRGSVVWTVWPLVLIHTVFATLVVVVTMKTNLELAIPNVMLTVLGVVLGFVISYRALSGYDRYYTGRTCWADIIKNSRVMARLIWYHVPPCRTPRTPEEQATGKLKRPKEELARVMAEKRSGLDLIEGFAVAVKHHLRGEAGIYYEDLYDLVKPLHPESLTVHTSAHFVSVTNSSQYDLDLSPVIQTPLDLARNTKPSNGAAPSTEEPTTSIHVPSFNAITAPATTTQQTRTNSRKWSVPLPPKPDNRTHKVRPKLPGIGGGANLPLEIVRCLSEWLSVLEDRGTVLGGTMGSLIGGVAAFEDSLGAMEKILAVPLP